MDSADHDMFRAAIHGDREAFEMIIRTMSRPLFAIAFGILQNREEAEDAVQDAFVKAWKSRWRVREPERLQGWISTIARHRAYDILRRRRTVPLDEQLKEFAAAGNGSELPDDERHRHSLTIPPPGAGGIVELRAAWNSRARAGLDAKTT